MSTTKSVKVIGCPFQLAINFYEIKAQKKFLSEYKNTLIMIKKNFILLFLLLSNLAFSQIDSISLKTFCPSKISQEGGLCFAYAPTYTALSIAHNVKENNTNENGPNFKVFSYGFVGSKVKKDKPWKGRIFNRCGRSATADMALDVLLNDGTVLFSQFPEECNCNKVDQLSQSALRYKISQVIEIGDITTNTNTHIQNIKNQLRGQNPVIIALYQESFFGANKSNRLIFPSNYKAHSTDANHVICIIGFNDGIDGGSFLIKNNYAGWGINGFSYVKYTDMIKLVRYSYTLKI